MQYSTGLRADTFEFPSTSRCNKDGQEGKTEKLKKTHTHANPCRSYNSLFPYKLITTKAVLPFSYSKALTQVCVCLTSLQRQEVMKMNIGCLIVIQYQNPSHTNLNYIIVRLINVSHFPFPYNTLFLYMDLVSRVCFPFP